MKKLMLLFLFVLFVQNVYSAPPSFHIFEGDVSCGDGAILLRNNEL